MIKNKANKFLNLNLSGSSKKFNTVKLIEMIIAFAFIVFGIILLTNKFISDKSIAIVMGIIIILNGANLIYSFIGEDSNKLFKVDIIFGIINLIIAILFFTNLIKFVNYINIYFSIYIIASGIRNAIMALELKLINEDSALYILVSAVLLIGIGLINIFYPFESFGTMETTGIFLILIGLLKFSTANLLRNRVEKFISKVDNY